MKAHLGEKIRDIRLKRSLTQNQVAQRAGINQSSLARLESGEHRDTRAAVLNRICAVLNVSIADLIGK